TPYGVEIMDTTSIGAGIPLQLEALPDTFKSYVWITSTVTNTLEVINDPTSRTPIVTLNDSTRFLVTAITQEGCYETATIYIRVAGKLKIPSGFTPNGDGINDYWEIGNAEGYPDLQVEVFNRWGSKVYSSRGYDNDTKKFDGTLHGKPLPMGTYYYIINIPGSDLKKGTVTIVR
ncbi:MAG TPA: gliding motility-associated C-terminal domain-containing protein, partial [Bacteroidales bacterium]